MTVDPLDQAIAANKGQGHRYYAETLEIIRDRLRTLEAAHHSPTRKRYGMATVEDQLIKTVEERSEFEILEDGYVYYWPYGKSGGGAISAWELRTIADELDRRNAAWSMQVTKALEA